MELPESHPAPIDEAEAAFATRGGCCCFWVPWKNNNGRSSVEFWERIRVAERADDRPAPLGRWWRKGLRALLKVREWSELVAGPRWKTFIRRFNRNSGNSRHGGGGMARYGSRFGYDPLSYALNFDEGNESPEGDGGGFRDFSARFAAPPVSAKSSMDLGGRDAPPLFAAAPAVAGGVS